MVMASLEELVIERCHDLLTPGAFQAMGACRGLKARLRTLCGALQYHCHAAGRALDAIAMQLGGH